MQPDPGNHSFLAKIASSLRDAGPKNSEVVLTAYVILLRWVCKASLEGVLSLRPHGIFNAGHI